MAAAGAAGFGATGLAGQAAEPVNPAGHRALQGPDFAQPPWRDRIHRLTPELGWLECFPGDSNPINKGFVSNLLVARHGAALWAVGSGPSPRFGSALANWCRAQAPGMPLELISPWAHPETVLGVAGFKPHRHWSHTVVAQEMAQRCPGCAQRLAQRMEVRAEELEIQLPTDHFDGGSGQLGPFQWQRLQRAADVTVTVWQHTNSGIAFAPGLLWGDAPPDTRDAQITPLADSLRALAEGRVWPSTQRWLGQQGAINGRERLFHAAAYLQGLMKAVQSGLDRGDDGMTPARQLKGVPPHWLEHPLHALNWQRAWRQAESS